MDNLQLLKLTEFFLKNPYKEFYLREISKKLKLSPFAIKKYSELLLKHGLILEERKANLRYFKANINNLYYKHLKISFGINLLLKSNILNFLKENISNLSSIVLFGSTARGLDDENSDIDLLIIGKEKYLQLQKFEDILKKEISLHIFSWNEWVKKAKEDAPFYFEVISHNILLYGELPLIKWK